MAVPRLWLRCPLSLKLTQCHCIMNCISKPQGRRRGLASFSFHISKKCLSFFNIMAYCCNMEAFLAGISFLQGKKVTLSHIFEWLSFIDTPKVYDQALILEGKVSHRYGLHFFMVRNAVHLKPSAFSVIQLFASNRLKLFTSIIHLFLTSWSICFFMECLHHVCCRTSQRTVMVSQLSP